MEVSPQSHRNISRSDCYFASVILPSRDGADSAHCLRVDSHFMFFIMGVSVERDLSDLFSYSFREPPCANPFSEHQVVPFNGTPRRRPLLTSFTFFFRFQDLKKQTALRLAQEQGQNQHGGGDPSIGYGPSPSTQQFSGGMPLQHGGVNSAQCPPHGNVPTFDHGPYGMENMGHTNPHHHHFQYHEQAPQAFRQVHPSNGPDVSAVSSATYTNHHNRDTGYNPDAQRPQTHDPHSSAADSSSLQPKAKLPHGLTVHELKEMTKARLQAEAAADMKDVLKGSSAGGIEIREQSADNITNIPPQFIGQRARTNTSQSRDTWSQDSRNEAWESGSVSTVASDYLGSESAYGTASCGGDDPSRSSYGRPSSFHSLPVNDFCDAPPDCLSYAGMAPSAGMFLDLPPNRRRAATLSPRQGLSYLHENREVLTGTDAPALPAFSTPTTKRLYPSRMRHFQNANLEANRPRTSSATSLPPISNTAEEFLGEEQRSFRTIQAGAGVPMLRDFASSPTVTGLADVFRESPSGLNERGSAITPSGFDEYAQAAIASPSAVHASSHSQIRQTSENDARGRASTWAGSSVDSIFGPGLIGGSNVDEHALSDDLAAILKLSVGDDEPSKDGRFFPPPGF